MKNNTNTNTNTNINTKYKIAIAWMGIAIALLTAVTVFMTTQAIQYSGRLSKIEERFEGICDLTYNPSTCKIGVEYLLGE